MKKLTLLKPKPDLKKPVPVYLESFNDLLKRAINLHHPFEEAN